MKNFMRVSSRQLTVRKLLDMLPTLIVALKYTYLGWVKICLVNSLRMDVSDFTTKLSRSFASMDMMSVQRYMIRPTCR